MQSLPTLQTAGIKLPLAGEENVPALSREVRELAAERNAVILAHNYQVPEVQEVADYVGDSLGLSQKAAAAGADTIAFCGVHFMAETASMLSPDKTVLLPDLDAGCSLADSITAYALRAHRGTATCRTRDGRRSALPRMRIRREAAAERETPPSVPRDARLRLIPTGGATGRTHRGRLYFLKS